MAAAGARAGDSSDTVCATGKKGHQLQWLPYRPTVPEADPDVRPAAHYGELRAPSADRGQASVESGASRIAAHSPAMRGPDSPFNDPFGDRDPASTSPKAGSLAQQDSLLPPVGPPGSLRRELPPLDDDDRLRIDEPGRMDDLPPARQFGSSLDEPLPPPRAFDDGAPARDDPLLPNPAPADDMPPPTPRGGTDDLEDIDRGYSREKADLTLKCVSPEDFRPLTDISTDIRPKGELPQECRLSEKLFDLETPRPWCPLTFTWKASGLCHKPLYFEQVHLERYGHSWGPYVQPFVSSAHFFLTVPILPYKMGLYPPNECMYSLGYYRPGNCAPYLLDPIPLSVRAGLTQASVWLGGIYMIP
jgi:hypothetical protein